MGVGLSAVRGVGRGAVGRGAVGREGRGRHRERGHRDVGRCRRRWHRKEAECDRDGGEQNRVEPAMVVVGQPRGDHSEARRHDAEGDDRPDWCRLPNGCAGVRRPTCRERRWPWRSGPPEPQSRPVVPTARTPTLAMSAPATRSPAGRQARNRQPRARCGRCRATGSRRWRATRRTRVAPRVGATPRIVGRPQRRESRPIPGHRVVLRSRAQTSAQCGSGRCRTR
ncbi:MAG: hypothetical protein QOF25_2082 [Mycobacterium sp.]|nr:hypothetical protein [Mycobacterium sp.]